MKTKLLGAVATMALLAGLSSAQAAIVDVTYTGTVYQGYDQSGMFGPPSGSLNGDSYKATYQFNTALGETYSSPTLNYAYGGSGTDYPSAPALSATVAINGVSVSSNLTGYADEIYGRNDGTFAQQYHSTGYYNYQAGNVYILNYASNYVDSTTNFTLPASITTPFSYSPQAGDGRVGNVQFYSYDYNTDTQTVDTWADATITNLTVSVVPGPAPGAGLLSLAFLVLAGVWTKARGFLAR